MYFYFQVIRKQNNCGIVNVDVSESQATTFYKYKPIVFVSRTRWREAPYSGYMEITRADANWYFILKADIRVSLPLEVSFLVTLRALIIDNFKNYLFIVRAIFL